MGVRGGCKCAYGYGKHTVQPRPVPMWMEIMMRRWLRWFPADSMPNSVNLNLYDGGEQSVGWHSDDEALFRGKDLDTTVISVSLGASRCFEVGLRGSRCGGKVAPVHGTVQ